MSGLNLIEIASRAKAFFEGDTKIVMTPENYKIVYEFYSQRNKELTEYLQPYIADGYVSDTVLKVAYKNFCEDERSGFFSKTLKVVKKVITKIDDKEEELIQELAQLQQELEEARQQSLIDPLTGAGNRAMYEDTITNLIESGESFSMAMLDIDHFKSINDNFGHGMGDAVIRFLTQTVQSRIGRADILTRVGGEEFVILSTGGYDLLLETAFEIKSALEEARLKHRESKRPLGAITASFGIAEYQSNSGVSKDDFYSLVDKALYYSKENGRNRITESKKLESSSIAS